MLLKKIGAALLTVAYVILCYPYAVEIAHHAVDIVHRNPLLRYWPVAVACAVSLVGILLAIVSAGRWPRWRWPSPLLTSGVIFIVYVLLIGTDPPYCLLVALGPHQHGCNSFIIAIVLGTIGLALSHIQGKFKSQELRAKS